VVSLGFYFFLLKKFSKAKPHPADFFLALDLARKIFFLICRGKEKKVGPLASVHPF